MQIQFHLNYLKNILKNITTITSALFKLRLGYSVVFLQLVLKRFTDVTEFSLTSQRHKISHNNTIKESKQIKELHSLEHEV